MVCLTWITVTCLKVTVVWPSELVEVPPSERPRARPPTPPLNFEQLMALRKAALQTEAEDSVDTDDPEPDEAQWLTVGHVGNPPPPA